MRAPAWLPARARRPRRCQSLVCRKALTPSPHDGDSCAQAACGRSATLPGRRRRHPSAVVGAQPYGYYLRGAVHPCGRCPGHTRPCGHDVPGTPAPRLTTQKKSLHASVRDTPRVQHVRQDDRQRLTALDLRRFTYVDDPPVRSGPRRGTGGGERAPTRRPPYDYAGGRGPSRPAGRDDGRRGDRRGRVSSVCQAGVGTHVEPGGYGRDGLWASPHSCGSPAGAMARRGARLLSVPRYSPDLSPIAPCWSKGQTALRTAKARTREALDTAMADVMGMVSRADAWGWFQQCGYPLQ
jgi:hypothetical protein